MNFSDSKNPNGDSLDQASQDYSYSFSYSAEASQATPTKAASRVTTATTYSSKIYTASNWTTS